MAATSELFFVLLQVLIVCGRYGVVLSVEDALLSEAAPADGWVEGQLSSPFQIKSISQC
jgi:hypothetical protein